MTFKALKTQDSTLTIENAHSIHQTNTALLIFNLKVKSYYKHKYIKKVVHNVLAAVY